MVKLTKKIKKSKTTRSDDTMTVPELRKCLTHMHRFITEKKPTSSDFVKEFQKVFHVKITLKQADEYLKIIGDSQKHATHATNTKHKQKGGAMNPAPLAYEMGPGSNTPSYPSYMSGGFRMPQDSVSATCGKDPFLPPAAGVGSNSVQRGGKRNTRKERKQRKQQGGAFPSIQTAISEFANRPMGMGSPPSVLQDITMLAKGYNGLASPRPEINNVHPPQTHTLYNASIAPITRYV